jgi:multisubunit Na+/H+ antiporter MnhB subunit
MEILLTLHSLVRWLIMAVGLVVAVKFAFGWRRGAAFKSMDRGLLSAFSGLMDMQVLLGFVFLFWNGLAAGAGFPRFRLEHMGIMLLAALVAHLPARWKNEEDKVRFRKSLFVVLDVLILVFVGIAFLPGGWSR